MKEKKPPGKRDFLVLSNIFSIEVVTLPGTENDLSIKSVSEVIIHASQWRHQENKKAINARNISKALSHKLKWYNFFRTGAPSASPSQGTPASPGTCSSRKTSARWSWWAATTIAGTPRAVISWTSPGASPTMQGNQWLDLNCPYVSHLLDLPPKTILYNL